MYQISIMSAGEEEKKWQLCMKRGSNYESKARKTGLRVNLCALD